MLENIQCFGCFLTKSIETFKKYIKIMLTIITFHKDIFNKKERIKRYKCFIYTLNWLSI